MRRTHKNIFDAILYTILAALIGCTSKQSGTPLPAPVPFQGKVLIGGQTFEKIDWTPEELAKERSFRKVKETDQGTYLLIRATKSDKPHVHDYHDVTAYFISGKGTFYMDGKPHPIKPGYIATIPKGTVH